MKEKQKCIIIKDETVLAPYLKLSQKDWFSAFKNLTRSAFGIYLYLSQFPSGHNFEYSPTAIEKLGLMTKGTATKAWQELIEKGYVKNNVFCVQTKE